jgi:hypothetical protein
MNTLLRVLVGLGMLVVGLLSISWGTWLWERVKNDSKVRLLSAVLTPKGARLFYVFLGMFVAVFGLHGADSVCSFPVGLRGGFPAPGTERNAATSPT